MAVFANMHIQTGLANSYIILFGHFGCSWSMYSDVCGHRRRSISMPLPWYLARSSFPSPAAYLFLCPFSWEYAMSVLNHCEFNIKQHVPLVLNYITRKICLVIVSGSIFKLDSGLENSQSPVGRYINKGMCWNQNSYFIDCHKKLVTVKCPVCITMKIQKHHPQRIWIVHNFFNLRT
jgi:hypothetical protein